MQYESHINLIAVVFHSTHTHSHYACQIDLKTWVQKGEKKAKFINNLNIFDEFYVAYEEKMANLSLYNEKNNDIYLTKVGAETISLKCFNIETWDAFIPFK